MDACINSRLKFTAWEEFDPLIDQGYDYFRWEKAMRQKRKQEGAEPDPGLTIRKYGNFQTRLHGPESGAEPPVVDQALWDTIESIDPAHFLCVGRPLPDHVEGLKPVFLDFLNNIEGEAETIKQRLVLYRKPDLDPDGQGG